MFVHEAVHAAVERLLRLASSGNWVQEALASAVQATLFPKSLESVDLAAGFAALAKGEKGTFLPWKGLLGKPHPAMGRYPQLITVLGFLRVKYRERLPRVWDALRALDGPVHEKALPAIAAALESTAADLERAWLDWGVGYYRK